MNPNAQPTRVESFDRSALAFFSNRRIRTRTYGGVGGAEPRGSPLSRSLAPLRHADRRCECLFIAVDRKWSIRGDFCAATGGAGSDMAGAGVARAGQSG